MTRADIAELERMLAAYRAAAAPSTKMRTRKSLETALVRNADALLAAAKAQRPPGGSYPELEPMAECERRDRQTARHHPDLPLED